MTPSSDAPPGMLHPPGTDAFPTTAPHSVRLHDSTHRKSWLARWWHAIFARNAYARGPDTVRSGRSGHRFFQHLIETDDTNGAPADHEAGEK